MATDWDRAFDNMGTIPGAAAYPDRWARRAAAFRQSTARLAVDLKYGDAVRQAFDLFLPDGEVKGVVVFVHGGYWMRLDKGYWSHLAAGVRQHGWAMAVPSYTLTPAFRIGDITREIGSAIRRIAAEVAGPIRLVGHSAGGHLVPRMLCQGTLGDDGVQGRIVHTVSVSGLHDLRPLLGTAMNDTLRLDAEEAASESPVLLRPVPGSSLTCWVGGGELPEFLRQSALLDIIWRGLDADTRHVCADDYHHFTVLDELEDSRSALVGEILRGAVGTKTRD